MAEFIEFLSANALAELQLANKELISMVANVEKVGRASRNVTLPSDVDKSVIELNENFRKQEEIIKNLQKQIERLTRTRQQSNQRTSEEIVNQRALAQNADRQARATSALVGAYANLNAQHQIASKRLQDLIIRGRTATQTQSQYNRELREAQRDFQNLDRRIQSADRAVGRFNRNVGNYPQQAIGGIKDLIGAFGIVGGASLFAGIANDIFTTTKELESLDKALLQVSGNQEQFARSQAFLKQVSEDFGIEIKALTTQFTQFYVSAKDKVSASEIENIFRSIAKAGSVMGLSVESQDRAFMALNQMMSKGVVSAEELRGQLGEALPGAFGIMAKALGTTEVGLAKLMKDGKLLANEVLPKFAKELEKVYGIETINRVETLASSQNRLSNEWTEFIRSLNEGSGVVSRFFKNMIDEISSTISWWRKLNQETGNFKENFSKKTEEGFSQQLKEIQKEADNSGVSLINLAKVRQKLAVRERDELREEIKLRQERVKLLLAENPNKILRGVTGIQDVIDSENKKILELSKSYGYYNGVVKATNYILKNNKTTIEEVTSSTSTNTEETKKNTKVKKEAEIYAIGSEKWLNKQISSLKELNNTLSITSEEYQVGVGAIKFYEQWLERLTGTAKKTAEELDGISLDLGGVEFLTDEEGDRIMEEGNKLRAWLKDFRKEFQDDFWQESGFGEIQFILDNWDNLKESGTDAALAISEAFQQAFNTIAQSSNANFQQMYSNLEQQRDVAILFAGESTTAREEIERQYEERRKRIQRQQAEAQKRLALFNIATNTAQGIMSALAMTPPNVPLSIIIGAIGAAQLALTASQPIPAFEKGGVHDGGLMLVNDGKGSNYRETIVTPDGKVMKPQGKNVVMNAPKGTQIFTHEQWQNKLNNLLLSNGIEQSKSTTEVNPIINVETKDNYHFEVNEKGFKTFVTRGQAKTEILNARFRQQKRYV